MTAIQASCRCSSSETGAAKSSPEIVCAMVGTAGHVDHGKTELVKLLTGHDTDHLREEKERGLSIDLGFAPCRLPNGKLVGIVDVPGHSDFIRNMVAGAASMDVLMLVVAADDGVMPQTDEHMKILKLMRVPRVMAVVTKSDLLDDELRCLLRDDVADFMTRTGFPDAPVILMSNKTGEGLGLVRETLGLLVDTVLAEAGSRPLDSHAFRMNIERVFSAKGCGTVVTGVPISGEVAVGDKLELLPRSVPTTVRGVQKFGHDARVAFAHECVAINLRDVDVESVPRGTAVCRPGPYRAVSALVSTLDNIDDTKSIARRAKVKLHVGTSVTNASLVLMNTEKLTPGQQAFAHVKLERPLVLTAGDRFIVRELSPPTTIGGGVVLSIDVQKRARRYPHLNRALELARDALQSGDLFGATLALSPAAGISTHELVIRTRCGGSIAEKLIAEKEAAGTIVNLGQSWLVRSRIPEIAERMKNALSRFHEKNRYAWGMAPTQVCRLLNVGPKDFTRLAEELARTDPHIVVKNGLLALESHEPALGKQEAALKDAIVRSVTTAGMTPPTRGNLANELGASQSDMRLLVRLLITEGAVTTAGSYLLSTTAFEQYRAKLLDLSSKDTSIDVKSFREATGASRRLAVAILETFDSKGLTRRVGQSRVLN